MPYSQTATAAVSRILSVCGERDEDTSVIDRLHVLYENKTNYQHHRPSYGQPSAKLRARPSQTTGATLANYGRDPVKLRARPCQTTGAGWPPAPQCIIFGISCTPDDCGFRSTYQTKKYTQTVNLIVLKGSHCNLPRHPNSILSSKCHPTASLSTMTWQAGRTKIMGLRIEKKP